MKRAVSNGHCIAGETDDALYKNAIPAGIIDDYDLPALNIVGVAGDLFDKQAFVRKRDGSIDWPSTIVISKTKMRSNIARAMAPAMQATQLMVSLMP